MKALLRYAFLKASRDGSFAAFTVAPIIIPFAALLGSTVGNGKVHRLHYPMFIEAHFSPVQNATLAGQVVVLVCVLFATLPAFWTLRSEIVSRSVGSLALAARPYQITIATILFATSLASMGSVIALMIVSVLTGALPAHAGLILVKIVAGALATSAMGMLAVTISPQPYMVVCMYFAAVAILTWSEKSKTALQLLAALVLTMVFTVIAAFLLERRCAS